MPKPTKPAPQVSIWATLSPYRNNVILLALLTIAANALTLWLPKIISHAIDAYAKHDLALKEVALLFGGVSAGIFVFTYLQNIVQVYVSELVAKDLRNKLSDKISRQTYSRIDELNPSRLLTNLTSDMDSIKMFVSQAVASLISSAFLIVGASFLLLTTNWKLGLAVLTIVPIIGFTFFTVLQQVRAFFLSSREVIDGLNRVINESILGAALVRVVNAEKQEDGKFYVANDKSYQIGVKIVSIFSALIPAITFVASLSSLIILAYGGHLVIDAQMTLGDFAAFSTYMAILIFPILILGFVGNIIAMATASYTRIAEVLDSPDAKDDGQRTDALKGEIEAKNLTVVYGEKTALKDVSFTIKPGSRTAIIGPTAAGKTQLLYVLTGLLAPKKGTVTYDGHLLADYDKKALHEQIGLVFQDSIVFNLTLRENIAFSTSVTDEAMEKAIATAELTDFVAGLPKGLNTTVSEQGKSLSGGQKQRLMLARALALNPKILLLDDFTARVDARTEAKILDNLIKNYPDLTLISVTQKISSIEKYDQILLLMEGELLAKGTHKELLKKSAEYMQIYSTQKSTNTYELHAD
jgi:ATP-binding cassette subfamily B protein